MHAARINSIISGSGLLDIDSSTGAGYVKNHYIWQYAAYILVVVIIALWVFCIIYSIYRYKKKHGKHKIQEPGWVSGSIVPDNAGSIVIVQGNMQGAEISLSPGEKIIAGRDPAVSSLVLSGAKVSRKHCSIQYSPEKHKYRLRCYSGNGLYYYDSKGSGRTKLEKDHVAWISYGSMVFMPGDKEILKLK